MARFYAEIRGSAGEATRQGTPRSGIRGHVRGWNVGASVECHQQGDRDGLSPELDWVNVSLTGGSSGYWSHEIAVIRELGGGRSEVTITAPDGRTLGTWALDAHGAIVEGATA